MRSLLLAIQFLTIVPITLKGEVTGAHMRGSVIHYPLVGLAQGLVLVLCDAVFGRFFGAELTSALILMVLAITSGALHLDGLCDTFDACAARGGRERRLEVMRTGSAGPVGVVALIFVLGIKYLALLSVTNLGMFAYYFTLIFMPALSRWGMVLGMALGKPARPDGLGAMFIGRLTPGLVIAPAVMLAILVTAPVLMVPEATGADWHVFNAAAMVLLLMFSLACARFAQRMFGGHTGDTLGAAGEITEALVPMMVIVWSRLSIS